MPVPEVCMILINCNNYVIQIKKSSDCVRDYLQHVQLGGLRKRKPHMFFFFFHKYVLYVVLDVLDDALEEG